jgi:hypothetical protein
MRLKKMKKRKKRKKKKVFFSSCLYPAFENIHFVTPRIMTLIHWMLHLLKEAKDIVTCKDEMSENDSNWWKQGGKTCIECTSEENYSYLTTEID